MRQCCRELHVSEYGHVACAHRTHQVDLVLVHAFVAVKQTDGDREVCSDDYKNDLRRHIEAEPKDQYRCDGDGRYGLGDDHQRVKCTVDHTEAIHQSRPDKRQHDTDEKTVKCFLEREAGMEHNVLEIACKGSDHLYRRRQHV